MHFFPLFWVVFFFSRLILDCLAKMSYLDLGVPFVICGCCSGNSVCRETLDQVRIQSSLPKTGYQCSLHVTPTAVFQQLGVKL